MAQPNSSYTELLSTTVQELEDELFDQILFKNAFTATLKEYDCIHPKDGGPTIVIPIMFAENGSYVRYSGAGILDTSRNDTLSAYNYSWAQFAINIQAHGREILQNSGRSQNRNLVKSRITNAKMTVENNFNIDLLSAGTATGGLQIGGLQLLIAADPTAGSVGGITRTTYSFSQNARYRALTDGGAVASASNIVGYFDQLALRVGSYRGNTKVILLDDTFFPYFEGACHALQRITDPNGKLASLGFQTYRYKQSEVVYEPQVAGMPSATGYFIDPEVLELCPHTDRNLVRLPKRDSWNQDATIEYLAWMGQLCAKNFRRLGVLTNS